MVDQYGNWTEEKDYSTYPRRKWCDMDHMANWVREKGYVPKTSMERLCTNMYISYVDYTKDKNDRCYAFCDPRPFPENVMLFMPDFCAYINDTGGFHEYDYEV